MRFGIGGGAIAYGFITDAVVDQREEDSACKSPGLGLRAGWAR